MNKKKIFLNTTDIAQMTGLDIRSARKMMNYIRVERGLGRRQTVSIYDFCSCFNLPIYLVFVYINTDLFNQGPLNEDEVRRDCQKQVLETSTLTYLYHKDFDLFMIGKDLKARQTKNDEGKGIADSESA